MKKRKCKISVAMASYNGEKYIKEQIDSILLQLSETDELIISDDGSKDNTKKIIESYKDNRIKLVEGPHDGIKKNFENSIKNCSGDYIFLCDQDDVWFHNKVNEIMKIFESNSNITLVMHNAEIVDDDMKNIYPYTTFEWRKSKTGIIKNVWKNSYIGCCMAFDRKLVKNFSPIPNNIEMHDQWIGIISDKYGKNYLLNKCLIKYRRHGDNCSSMEHHDIKTMLSNRLKFLYNFFRRIS